MRRQGLDGVHLEGLVPPARCVRVTRAPVVALSDAMPTPKRRYVGVAIEGGAVEGGDSRL